MIEGQAAVFFNDVEFLVGSGSTQPPFLLHIRAHFDEIEVGDPDGGMDILKA